MTQKMSQKELRKSAIKAFKKHDFNKAIALFSLAYEKDKSHESLLFIELCRLAKGDEEGVVSLFEIYSDDLRKNQSKNLKSVIEIVENTNHKTKQHLDNANGVSYKDFISIAKQTGDFRKTFENTIYSSKIIISSQHELANFIENLIENDYLDLAIHYLEVTKISINFRHLVDKLKAKL